MSNPIINIELEKFKLDKLNMDKCKIEMNITQQKAALQDDECCDLLIANSIFVQKKGNDETAKPYYLNQAFLTVQAAIDAAKAGDTIFVYPGVYEEAIVLKNLVDIHFHEGAMIRGYNSPVHLISDGGETIHCHITGEGSFALLDQEIHDINVLNISLESFIQLKAKSAFKSFVGDTEAGPVGGVIGCYGNSSGVLEFDEIIHIDNGNEGAGSGVILKDYADIKLFAKKVESSGRALLSRDHSTLYVAADEVSSVSWVAANQYHHSTMILHTNVICGATSGIAGRFGRLEVYDAHVIGKNGPAVLGTYAGDDPTKGIFAKNCTFQTYKKNGICADMSSYNTPTEKYVYSFYNCLLLSNGSEGKSILDSKSGTGNPLYIKSYGILSLNKPADTIDPDGEVKFIGNPPVIFNDPDSELPVHDLQFYWTGALCVLDDNNEKTGFYRRKTIHTRLLVNGAIDENYQPLQKNLTDAFVKSQLNIDEPSLTDDEFQKLPDDQYLSRLENFYAYLAYKPYLGGFDENNVSDKKIENAYGQADEESGVNCA